jgi:signal transduction histidine kinase
MKNENSRASDIVASVRALFKTTAPQRTMVEINRLLREMLRMVENDLHVHGVSVSTEFQEDIPQVRADPIQLRQVILNLVKNAIDAIAIGPTTITAIRLITTHDGKSAVSLYVQDTGPGVTLDDETQIFGPFLRRNIPEWDWDFPFLGGSSRITAAIFGSPRQLQKAALLKSLCRCSNRRQCDKVMLA